MKLLVAEDNSANAELLVRILEKGGYQVVLARNGKEALEKYQQERFDAVLTDWLMPQMDGMELIREIYKLPGEKPLTLVITVMDSPEAKNYALEVLQVDDYITKPIHAHQVLESLRNIISRRDQPLPSLQELPTAKPVLPVTKGDNAPFAAIAMAVSTGGPGTLRSFFATLQPDMVRHCAIVVLQHGPGWMVKALQEKISEETPLTLALAEPGMPLQPGVIYFVPGSGEHYTIAQNRTFKPVNTPPENFVKPAADPLFKSIADVFGRQSIGVVMTGLGRDGAVGCSYISAAGGKVLIQDPDTAVAPFMPRSVLDLKLQCEQAGIETLATLMMQAVSRALPPILART